MPETCPRSREVEKKATGGQRCEASALYSFSFLAPAKALMGQSQRFPSPKEKPGKFQERKFVVVATAP